MMKDSQLVKLLVLVAAVFVSVDARFRCHNRCSGHGVCSDYENICYCEDGYQGVDCSERVCPKDFAWASKAYSFGLAHERTECSNAGRCNRRTGLCECAPGFMGVACEKTKCGGSGPEGCSGHGDCLTLGETYELLATRRAINITAAYIADPPPWESTHATMCSCHVGYAGASCEYRLCPKGDDLLTPHTGYRTITITVRSDRRLTRASGRFHFQFNGESFFFPPGSGRFTAAQCKAAFQSLRNVREADCQITLSNDFDVVYRVQLRKFPVIPYEANVFTNDGNPPLSAFSCNNDQIVKAHATDRVECLIGETGIDKVYPEYVACSNRGICDFTSGVCFCFEQFQGANCGQYKRAIAEPSVREVDTSQVLKIESSNPLFDKTLLKFQTFDIGTERFNTLTATNIDRRVFEMDGYGNVKMNYGGLLIGGSESSTSSGMTVNAGGIAVTGGMVAESDTLVINGRTNVKGGITVTNGGFNVVGDSSFDGFSGIVGGFSVRKGMDPGAGIDVVAGGGTVNTGGLALRGGLTIASSGLTVNKRGVTIFSGGLCITGGIRLLKVRSSVIVGANVAIGSDGMVVNGGLTLNDVGLDTGGGMSINSGGLVVETSTIYAGGVYVNGGLSVAQSGITITGGLTVNDVGLRVDSSAPSNVLGGATIAVPGLRVTDGMAVDTVGVVVTGGATITAGDVNILCTTPIRIGSSGLTMATGLTVEDTGMYVTGGVTVLTNGLVIEAGGLNVEAGGLKITNGLTVSEGGLRVHNGATVSSVGLITNDQVSVSQGGMRVVGGVTLYDGGLTIVGGGITVGNGGLRVTDGATLVSGGISVTGGMSVTDGGRSEAGLSVLSGGFRVTGGLTVDSVSLSVSGGLSVITNGLIIPTIGLSILSSGVTVASGLTIPTAGLYITGGLSVANVGVNIIGGGLRVASGALRVTGGMTVYDAAARMEVIDGMTVFAGAVVTSGVTITTAGLVVGGGSTIAAGGLKVVGGATVSDGAVAYSGDISNGLRIAEGLTVTSAGLTVETTGVTIDMAGLSVTGGISLEDNGLRATGGLSIRAGGLGANTAMTVFDNGLVVSGGVTVGGNGITSTGLGNLRVAGGLSSAADMTVGANGLRVTGGLTVSTAGISGLSLQVRDGGVRTTGSVTVRDNGLAVYGASTILGSGMNVAGGITVRGMSFSSTTNLFTNQVNGGLVVKGATPVEVKNIGVSSAEGMTVNGVVYISGSATTSDARLKTNISGFANPLGMVSELRGVYYKWIDPKVDEDSGRQRTKDAQNQTEPLRYVGVLAQEVQRVLPEVVSEGSLTNGTLSVRYTELVALLIEAIKVLDEQTRVNGSTVDVAAARHRSGAPMQSVTTRPMGWKPEEWALLRRYFNFDPTTGQVESAKPYHGACDCGEPALEMLLPLLRRIESLEREETALLQRLQAVTAM